MGSMDFGAGAKVYWRGSIADKRGTPERVRAVKTLEGGFMLVNPEAGSRMIVPREAVSRVKRTGHLSGGFGDE